MTHKPVLISEMLFYLSPQEGEVFLDATFGGGGYTQSILDVHPSLRVIALDRDPDARLRAQAFQENNPNRFTFYESRFSEMDAYLPAETQLHGVVFDFGISSFQIDTAERGFSFRFQGPLDMRMSQTGQSAYDVVNTFSKDDLARIIDAYGEEPRAEIIAKTIVAARTRTPIKTTEDLAKLVRSVAKGKKNLDPATKTFQALRIFINDELMEVKVILDKIFNYLLPGGRIILVSFHGLEDRVIKTWARSNECAGRIASLTGPVVTPSSFELRNNPRARSGRLRAYKVLGM